MIAGFFGTVYTLWLYTGWLPYYLEHERHMSVARVGIVAAIPYFFGCLGAVVGGWLCDFLTRRGWTPIAGRKLLISSALCGISFCTAGTALAQSNTLALVCIRPRCSSFILRAAPHGQRYLLPLPANTPPHSGPFRISEAISAARSPP